MRKYLVTIGCNDTSQFGKEFKNQYIIKGYSKAKAIVNDILKYQTYTGNYAKMELIKNKKINNKNID